MNEGKKEGGDEAGTGRVPKGAEIACGSDSLWRSRARAVQATIPDGEEHLDLMKSDLRKMLYEA